MPELTGKCSSAWQRPQGTRLPALARDSQSDAFAFRTVSNWLARAALCIPQSSWISIDAIWNTSDSPKANSQDVHKVLLPETQTSSSTQRSAQHRDSSAQIWSRSQHDRQLARTCKRQHDEQVLGPRS